MPEIAAAANGSIKTLKDVITTGRVSWGRTTKAKWHNNVAALLVIAAPTWVYFNWLSLEKFGGSFLALGRGIMSDGLCETLVEQHPQFSFGALLGYSGWFFGQALLYALLPGKECFGQRTPGGHLLQYTANGLMAWSITHLVYLSAAVLGLLDPAIIAKNWSGLFVAANVFGYASSVLALLKGYCSPSHPEDAKTSGSQFHIIECDMG
jgi:7-dehydrocholesterol reductase